MTNRPFLPVQLYRLHKDEQKRQRRRDASQALFDDPDRLPGMGFLDNPEQAYEEMKLVIEKNPDIFYSPSWIPAFVDQYPEPLRPAVRSMIGRHLQSVVDLEHSLDPMVEDAIYEDRATPVLRMGAPRTPSQKADDYMMMGPVGFSKYKMSNAPNWDTPRGNVYLEKVLHHGRGKVAPETYMDIAEAQGDSLVKEFYQQRYPGTPGSLPKSQDEGDER